MFVYLWSILHFNLATNLYMNSAFTLFQVYLKGKGQKG